ncbi:MAG: hypothetical protein K0S44_2262 [Bacteroidetes bacterium]|jgi:gliding motility-associated-like protein/uncharacterized repeat protein (TIGR01451 family)|nr:hypothetical protein [Bacteroidota bacterium]
MKKIFILLALMILPYLSEAQTVTIPDTHFANWLRVNIPAAMSGNQLDTGNIQVKTLDTINVSSDTICSLEGIQYFTSLKYLDCSNNRLDTLLNLPDSLKALNCSLNRLIYIMEIPDSVTFFDCRENELDSLPALPVHLVYFSCNGNSLRRIASLPATITYFDCTANRLDSLPSLPANLPELKCAENQLTGLPSLPSSLITIDCKHNLLSGLPSLPLMLRTMDCSSNQLTSLPSLPDSLSDLNCSMNQLSALPVLPNALITLTCGTNLLNSLPALPSTLITLVCYGNTLSNLPVLPVSLYHLDCGYNNITVLPSLGPSLHYLDCQRNRLNVLPAFTNMLCTVNCSGNLLANLPSLPGSLRNFICSFNPLSGLPSLASLYTLDCSNCTLDSLPSLPSSLSSLDCSFNSLTVLPSVISVSNLMCNNNQLSALPVLSSSLYLLMCSNNNINCFEEFPSTVQWIDIDNNPYFCLPNYLPVMPASALSHPLCIAGDTLNNPYSCTGAEGIVGFTYIDNNSTCLRDSLDVDLMNIALDLYDSNGQFIGQTYTALNGIYHFPESAGVYEVRVDTTGMPISPQCSNTGIDSVVTLTVSDPLISNVNFGFDCKPGFDVGVRSVVNNGLVFPGQIHQLKIDAGDMTQWYNMACAAGISGQVQLTVNGPVNFSGITTGALTPSVNGNVFTYSIPDFGGIINTQAFGLELMVDSTAGDGDNICVIVNVTPLGTDRDTTNNSYNFCYKVVNSHDPNIKETYPESVSMNYDGWLTYTVHFQNTGSAPAINITLKDTLDTQLDLTTFEAIAYSHHNQIILSGNALMIRFPNIYLSDSTSDADSSKGYFQYRIKPLSNLSCGSTIHNTASIYFDFNEAVVTNTTVNSYPISPDDLILSDTTICYGSSLTLNVQSDGNAVNWMNSNNELLGSGNSINIQNVNTSSALYVQSISPAGCASNIGNINVAVLPPVSSPLLSGTDTICYSDTLKLSAASINGWDYHWSGPAGFISSVEDPHVSPLSDTHSGFYELYVSKGSCLSDTAGVYIKIYSQPYIAVTSNPDICFGDSVDLYAYGNLNYILWSTGNTTHTINVSPLETTLYLVNGGNVCGTVNQNILVTVNTPPVAIALDAILINGESTSIHAEGGSSYLWFPLNGLSCSDCQDPDVSITNGQSYSVIVTDDRGCKDTTDMFVHVKEENNTVYVPNSFTPNGDGLNDEFKVQGKNIAEIQMNIYQRSGEMIFESSDMSKGWNGIYKTNLMNRETYVYTVRVVFEDGTDKSLKGYVTLVR